MKELHDIAYPVIWLKEIMDTNPFAIKTVNEKAKPSLEALFWVVGSHPAMAKAKLQSVVNEVLQKWQFTIHVTIAWKNAVPALGTRVRAVQEL